MLMMLWKFLIFSLFLIKIAAGARLETSNDDAVLEALRENRNLAILFSKLVDVGRCRKCFQQKLFSAKKGVVECPYEQSLAALSEEFESVLDGFVLKLEGSQLQRIYDIQKKETTLVYLRKGVGVLYDGPDSAEEIYAFFSEHRDPIVKELDDSNFEHLTQASSGSTTGDWLIHFYDNQCIDCNRLTATWETVAAKLKNRMNVARVNRGTKGVLTAKRFKVDQVPEFIFLRLGKYYRYNLKNHDIESFVGFAKTWYHKLTPEKVITPATPFENLVDSAVKALKDLPNVKQMFERNPLPFVVVSTFACLLVLVLLFRKPKAKEAERKPADGKKVTKKEK